MITSGDAMRAAGREFVASLGKSPNSATIVTLSGELGAGKTTFVQGIAEALGIAEHVTSPTFILEKIYSLEAQRWEWLIHIDAYRLERAEQLAVLEWDHICADPGALVLLEWPERVPGAIPAGAIRLRFEIQGDGRIITNDGDQESKKGGQEGSKNN